jgi:hypothetical protein
MFNVVDKFKKVNAKTLCEKKKSGTCQYTPFLLNTSVSNAQSKIGSTAHQSISFFVLKSESPFLLNRSFSSFQAWK